MSYLFGILCSLLGQSSLNDVLVFLNVEHLELFNHLDDEEAVLDHLIVLLLSELTTMKCRLILVLESLDAIRRRSAYATPVVILFLLGSHYLSLLLVDEEIGVFPWLFQDAMTDI